VSDHRAQPLQYRHSTGQSARIPVVTKSKSAGGREEIAEPLDDSFRIQFLADRRFDHLEVEKALGSSALDEWVIGIVAVSTSKFVIPNRKPICTGFIHPVSSSFRPDRLAVR